MPYYQRLGSIPRKRHTAHRVSPGYRNEASITRRSSRRRASAGRTASSITSGRRRVKEVQAARHVPSRLCTICPLRHLHKTGHMAAKRDPITGRVPVFANQDVVLSRCRPAKAQEELFRNATADEIIFVHHGSGRLLTMFGILPIKPFDYVVIPRTTTYMLEFDEGSEPDLLVIEATGNLGFPPRYLNPDGQFRMGAPFCERDLHGPVRA